MNTTPDHVWYAMTVLAAAALLIDAACFVRMRQRFTTYNAVMIFGAAFEAVAGAVSLTFFWPDEANVTAAFALSRAAGRSVEALCALVHVLYLVGVLNGVRRGDGGEGEDG